MGHHPNVQWAIARKPNGPSPESPMGHQPGRKSNGASPTPLRFLPDLRRQRCAGSIMNSKSRKQYNKCEAEQNCRSRRKNGGLVVFRCSEKNNRRCAAILAPPAFGLRRQRKSVLVPFLPGTSRKSINFNKKIYIDSFSKDASIETPEKCMLYGEFLRNGSFLVMGSKFAPCHGSLR